MTIAYDKKAAAKALKLSVSEFTDLVEHGILPPPRVLGPHERWFHADLEAAGRESGKVDLDEVQW